MSGAERSSIFPTFIGGSAVVRVTVVKAGFTIKLLGFFTVLPGMNGWVAITYDYCGGELSSSRFPRRYVHADDIIQIEGDDLHHTLEKELAELAFKMSEAQARGGER